MSNNPDHELWTAINRVLDQGGLASLTRLGISPDDLRKLLTIGRTDDCRVLLGLPDDCAAGPVAALLALIGQSLLELEDVRRERGIRH